MKLFAKSLLISILISVGGSMITPVSAQDTNPDCPGGICAKTEDLTKGTAKMDIYGALGMSHKNKAGGEAETSVMSFIQDIIYAATYFIGSVVTVALIVSGLLYIFSGANSGNRNTAKRGFTYALIGLVIVSMSVIIVRAVQYLARGGS